MYVSRTGQFCLTNSNSSYFTVHFKVQRSYRLWAFSKSGPDFWQLSRTGHKILTMHILPYHILYRWIFNFKTVFEPSISYLSLAPAKTFMLCVHWMKWVKI